MDTFAYTEKHASIFLAKIQMCAKIGKETSPPLHQESQPSVSDVASQNLILQKDTASSVASDL
jgi:hypothetical protein